MKKVLVLAVAMMATMMSARAEESNVEFAYEAGAEVVSSYIWRGQYNGGLSFQPEALVGFNALDGAFEFRGGVWANIGASDWVFKSGELTIPGYNPNTQFKPELDIMLTASAYGASVGFTHYYYCDGGSFFSWGSDNDVFVNGDGSTTEIWFGYNFDHFFGQGAYINWYTTIAGNDFFGTPSIEELSKGIMAHRAWSTYIELGYDYTWEQYGLTLGGQIGLSPWGSDLYMNESFACTNISLKVNKEWEFDLVTLDLFAQGSINPDHLDKNTAFVWEAGDDKLYVQKINGVIGVGIWF